MIFNVPELRAFIAVVRRGSCSGAAAELNLSQPALSRRIDLIEGAVGAPLLERYHDGARLTEAGRALLPHAEAALAKLQDGAESVRSALRGESGELVLALVASLCNPAVMNALEAFRRESPGVRLRLRTASSAEVSKLVQRGEASFGLRYRADRDRRMRCETIGHETMSVICAPAHPLAKAKSVPAARLLEETWIVWPLRPSDPESGFQRVLASYGLRGRHTMVTDSTLLQKRLIEANFGIGLLSRRSIEEELGAGKLCALNVASMRGQLPVTLVQRKGAYLGETTQRLMKTLAATFTTLAQPSGVRPRK
jgi:DNA-binding transcriptional LysR family regulator